MESTLALAILLLGFPVMEEPTKVSSIEEIRALPAVTREVIGEDLSDDDLVELTRLTKLSMLDLSGSPEISLAGLNPLGYLADLQDLRLPMMVLLDPGLPETKFAGLVKRVDWGGIHDMSAERVAPLAKLTSIEEIDFRSCSGINPYGNSRIIWTGDGIGVNDAALASLASLKKLRRLDLTHCHSVTDEGVAIIGGQFPELRRLVLSGCTLSDEGLRHLSTLKKIEFLDLSNLYDLKGAGLAVLAGLPALETLKLRWCTEMRSASLEPLADCARLADLDLTYCKALDAGAIEHLVRMSALRKLNLFGLKWVTTETAPELTDLKGLTELDIGAPGNFTDVGLGAIARMKGLESLGLQACKQISFEGLKKLAGMKLRHLNVYFTQSDFDDEQVISWARTNLPGCELRLPSGKLHRD